MTKLADLHKSWSEEPEYRAEYERLGPEFALARSLIEASPRMHAHSDPRLQDRSRQAQPAPRPDEGPVDRGAAQSMRAETREPGDPAEH